MILDLTEAENAILAKHGMTKASVSDAAQLEPHQRKPNEQACIDELVTLWKTEAPVVVTDAAELTIAQILVTLPPAEWDGVVRRALTRAADGDV